MKTIHVACLHLLDIMNEGNSQAQGLTNGPRSCQAFLSVLDGPFYPWKWSYFEQWHHMDHVKRIWYLSPMRAAKVQASLRIRAVSPEPALLAHTGSESRGTFRQKARSLALLNGWACAVKICHDGMLEDTNSLDGPISWTKISALVISFQNCWQNYHFTFVFPNMMYLFKLTWICSDFLMVIIILHVKSYNIFSCI